MFRGGFGDSAVCGECRTAEQGNGIMEIADLLEQESVMRCSIDMFVKTLVLARMDNRVVRQGTGASQDRL